MTILTSEAVIKEKRKLIDDCPNTRNITVGSDWILDLFDTIADRDKQIEDLRAKVEEERKLFTCPQCNDKFNEYYSGHDCNCGQIHLCSRCYYADHKSHDGAVKEPEAVMPDSSSSGRVAFLLQPPRENQDEQACD